MTESWHRNLLNPYSDAPSLSSSSTTNPSLPVLNRKTRQKLSKEINRISLHVRHIPGNETDKPTIELKKHLARPPGCSFLGARATETFASINNPQGETIPVIIDSGSDITLISQRTLDQMSKPPKIRTGQRIKLVQVTGNASITGYVTLDLYFKTEEGPVLANVEAYIVKGMSAPFIFGNDFADQYSISLLREEGESTLLFGKSGRSQKVHNSVTSSLLDEDGHAFKIRVQPDIVSKVNKAKVHRKSQKAKRRLSERLEDDHIRAASSVVIGPESVKLVKVHANFATNSDYLFVEKKLATNGSAEDVYGCADMLITKKAPYVYVSNFSKKPVNITAGQTISQGYNPSIALDKEGQFTHSQREGIIAHANLLQSIINSEKTSTSKNPFVQTVKCEVKTLYDASR